MVTLEYIAMSAHTVWLEKGTKVSKAFLIAMGLPIPKRASKVAPTHRPPTHVPEHQLMECFENHGSPLDGIPHG